MLLRDAVLASAHHLLAFGLLGVLAAEFALIRNGPVGDAAWLKRLGRLDLAYGLVAGVLVVVGIARVALSPKTPGFYLHNPFFWAKMAAFLGVALMSVPPTVAFIRWRRPGAAAPSTQAVAGVRRWLALELCLFAAIPVLAALMARWAGP